MEHRTVSERTTTTKVPAEIGSFPSTFSSQDPRSHCGSKSSGIQWKGLQDNSDKRKPFWQSVDEDFNLTSLINSVEKDIRNSHSKDLKVPTAMAEIVNETKERCLELRQEIMSLPGFKPRNGSGA